MEEFAKYGASVWEPKPRSAKEVGGGWSVWAHWAALAAAISGAGGKIDVYVVWEEWQPRMNIFFLSAKPGRCARWHCDKHVVKMILESTQILYTAHHIWESKALEDAPLCVSTGKRGYKKHSAKHPSVMWAAAALPHYIWLCWLGLALVKEHQHRFGPVARHSCGVHLDWLLANPPERMSEQLVWICDPTPAMPDEYKVAGNSVASYRRYYLGQKKDRGLLKWSRRHTPHWAVAKIDT